MLAFVSCGKQLSDDIHIPTGMGDVVIHAPPSPGLLSVTVHDQKGKVTELFSGTNIILDLLVGADGCVGGITGRNGGYYSLDFFGTRVVQQETGETTINNPVVVIRGKTNDIVAAWVELSKTDGRFVIDRQKSDSNKSNGR